MKLPEILAPAGNRDALEAAVRAGADAVYVGARRFNARQRGDNFSLEDLRDATRYCHLHQVAIYGTVNILMKEEELEEAVSLVDELYFMGMDGLILQDLGLYSIVHERYPDFPIHSSTQMFIHGRTGVQLLEELGFQRVVLARELTLKEIKSIKEASKAEIKIFCHGALCICYSGQCYMSSLIGGRSGNRGRCAQPCRKIYSLYDEKGQLMRKGHLISPRDLNTLDMLEEIVETGVDSLKIEGRLKNPEYVYTSVRAYKEGLEALGQKKKGNIAVHEIFNRKYTQGYLKTPKPSGKDLLVEQGEARNRTFAATLDRVEGYRYRFQGEQDLAVGDGIWVSGKQTDFGEILSSLFDKKGRPVEIIRSGEFGFLELHKPAQKGDSIYKTSDARQRRAIEESMREDHSRKQGFRWEVELVPGHKPTMKITLGNMERVIPAEEVVQEARKAPLTKERVVEQLSKLGDTPFQAESIEVQMEGAVFMPISAINQLRRVAVENLQEMMLARYKRTTVTVDPWKRDTWTKPMETEHPKKMAVKVKDREMLSLALGSQADEILYGWDDPLDIKSLDEVCSIVEKKGRTFRLVLPRILREGAMKPMESLLNRIGQMPVHGFLVGSYEGLQWARSAGKSVETDEGFNVYNTYTLDVLKSLGVDLAYLSSELNQNELGDAFGDGMGTGLVVHGPKELMVMEYGLDIDAPGKAYTLVDQKGYRFPVMKDGFGRSHLFNAKTLCLLDKVSQLTNVDKIRIDALFQEPELLEIVASYKEALEGPMMDLPDWFEDRAEIWTTGHFNRGVI